MFTSAPRSAVTNSKVYRHDELLNRVRLEPPSPESFDCGGVEPYVPHRFENLYVRNRTATPVD
jgi:hypothetical protein